MTERALHEHDGATADEQLRKRRAFGRIVAAVATLNADETEAAAYILGRFAGGAKVYGHYTRETERRDMRAEAAAEVADWNVYEALRWHMTRGAAEGEP